MKYFLVLAALVTTALLVIAQSGTPTSYYVDHDKVTAALKKNAGSILIRAAELKTTVEANHRDNTDAVSVHDETDVYYVIDGEATIVTGGIVVGGTPTKTGGSTGGEIRGGEERHLSKGDVIIIPSRSPHWFKQIPKSIDYLVVKVPKP